MKKHYEEHPKMYVQENVMNTLKTCIDNFDTYHRSIDDVPIDKYNNILEVPEGTAGALVIPDLNFYVPLYYEWDGESAQEVCDRERCAVLIVGRSAPIIADHENQGFSIIKQLEIGQVCYIQEGENSIKYLCTGIDFDGVNDDGILIGSDGTMLHNLPENMLVLYTCNDISESITNVLFTRIEEENEANIVFVQGDGFCDSSYQASITF